MIKDRNIDDNAQIQIHKLIGAGQPQAKSTYALYVDSDKGNDGDTGRSPSHALKTIQKAVDKAAAWWTIYVFRRTGEATGTDPYNYEETIIIPRTHEGLSIIGVGAGRTQGGLPQIKPTQTQAPTTALITVRAPGCLIANMGFNGTWGTGGGILLEDDSGATTTAFGTVIQNCHFKNCKGTSATNAATGGAIQWGTDGQGNQVLIKSCRFYKCVGDIVLLGTSEARPQDVIIEDCVFSGPAANTDCNLYLAGGSGMNGVIIRDCYFTAMPALGGTNDRYVVLTGCVGMIANCYFASITNDTDAAGTFAANGSLAKIPAEVLIVHCFGETTTTTKTAEIIRT